jgi:peptide/nickel transport system substrate-binding protein
LKKSRLALVLLLIGSAAFAQTPRNGGTVVIAYYDEPTSLDSLALPNGVASIVNGLVTNGLVKNNDQLGQVPDLCERWETSSDGLTWTFYLRKGVHFSDATEFTADDVAFTIREIQKSKYHNTSSIFVQTVKSFEAESRYVFKVYLRSPYGLLSQYFSKSIGSVRQYQTDPPDVLDRHPIGTGPFKIADWVSGQITLDANLDYFEGRPHLDRIILKLYSDQKKAWTALMQGEADVVPDVDYEDYAVIKNDTRFRAYEYIDPFCHALYFNLKDPLLSQPRIRQAIAAAIDRNDLIDKALQGGGVATNGPFQPGTWEYNPDPTLQAFNPQKAKKILADLGWRDNNSDWILEKDGKDLQFTVLVDKGDKLREATAKRLQWQLLQVGIKMNVEVLPLDELMMKRIFTGQFQAFLNQNNTSMDPDFAASNFWDSGSIGRNNITSYSNPEVDSLIRKGRVTSDPALRKQIYQKMHALISSDAPATFLFYRKRYTACSSRLQGFESAAAIFFSGKMNKWWVDK